ncbi:MAG: ATP-dependent zinc metalloprotease FtsH [Pirellulales bacterium]
MSNAPDDRPNSSPDGPNGRSQRPVGVNLIMILMILGLFVAIVIATLGNTRSEVPYPVFEKQVRLPEPNILKLEIGDYQATGVFKDPPEMADEYDDSGKLVSQWDKSKESRKRYGKQFFVNLPRNDTSRERLLALLQEHNVDYRVEPNTGGALEVLWLIAIGLSIGMFVFFWFQFRRTREQLMGGGFLTGFAKSPAKRYEAARQPITFKDVAGLEGVKADLLEIVEFLKSPQKFQKLGGRIPKGVLLNGPPGTGKTLLARAVAGEAGVPFFSVNGSEFIQMFVGVGASRVRDLFKTAKENSPCIVFIDEIDAVGRQRGAGLGGGHDEREQTLNQILGEMDGFSPSEAVIVLAATNRPDVLDPALLRPGRFDRHITVGRPTQKGRVEIFKVHVREVPLAEDVDLQVLAASTIGLTGADIRNIVNEAALWAARQNKTRVAMDDFDHARDKVLMGAKREEVLQPKEKERTAYHEAGHTLAAWLLKGAHRVHKVTVIPRGRSLGSTQTMPSEDRLNMSESELRDQLVVMLGGRAAEQLIYNETTVGAENDLERATSLARHMVTHWGMSERMGPVSYKLSEDDPFLGREIQRQRAFSERTMESIDDEVAKLLRMADHRALKLLTDEREKLENLTQALVRQEELDEREIESIIGASVHGRGPLLRDDSAPLAAEIVTPSPNPADGAASPETPRASS